MSAISVGAIGIGVYTTNREDACAYIASHSKSTIVFVENDLHLQKFLKIRDQLPNLKYIVQWTGKAEHEGVMDWTTFLSYADEEDEKYKTVVEERISNLSPSECCSLIYTSGTTGNPKACMLSHDNLVWTAHVTMRHFGFTTEEKTISYLPLSHVAAQLVDIHVPLACGSTLYFAQPDAMKGSLSFTLKDVRPTCFLGVPRVWEKIKMKIEREVQKSNYFKRKLFDYAIKTGSETHLKIEQGIEDEPFLWNSIKRLVWDKIRETLGLDHTRIFVSAAAPMTRETLEFFLGLNMPVYEIYGMSECTGPQTFSDTNARKTGSAGYSVPGTEIKIDNPDSTGEGEICFRGRHIMLGYKDNAEETAKIFDDEGYLHSGDLGRIDENGFVNITGRIKELIITAGGENVPPVPIENFLKKELGKIVSNVMIVGDKRQFLTCLITLKAEAIVDPPVHEYPFKDALDPFTIEELKNIGSPAKTVTAARDDRKLHKFIDDGIKLYNKQATSNAQQIGKWAILPRDFTVEGDELTPSMKLKRRIVLEKYADIIEDLYNVAQGTNI